MVVAAVGLFVVAVAVVEVCGSSCGGGLTGCSGLVVVEQR